MAKVFWIGFIIFLGGFITWLISGLVNKVYFDTVGFILFGIFIFGILLMILSWIVTQKR